MKNTPSLGRVILIVWAKVGCGAATVASAVSILVAVLHIVLYCRHDATTASFFIIFVSIGLLIVFGFVAFILARVANKLEKPFIAPDVPKQDDPNATKSSVIRREGLGFLIAMGAAILMLVASASALFIAFCVRECIPNYRSENYSMREALIGAGIGAAIFGAAFFGAFKLGRTRRQA